MKGDAEVYGRAREMCATRQFHVWAALATDVANPYSSFASPFVEAQGFEIEDACDHGLWQITTSVVEYLRSSGEGTLNPLPALAINDPSLGGGATRQMRSVIKLRANVSDGAGPRELNMDMNQSVGVVSRKICSRLLTPAGARDVNNNNNTAGPEFALSGFVIDSFVTVAFTRMETPVNNNTAIFTTRTFSAAGTQTPIQIPPFARAVTVYQAAGTGAASVMWTQHLGNPSVASIEIGALPFIAGTRTTQQESINPDASFLRTDLDALNDRFYTLVWSIRP